MKVLVCGSRDYSDRAYLHAFLDELADVIKVDTIIDGGARGADELAYQWATVRMGINTERYFAMWREEGKAAGWSRNRRMLREGQPGLVVAFPLAESRGTWHMVRIAREAGVTTWVMPQDRHIITALGEGVFV